LPFAIRRYLANDRRPTIYIGRRCVAVAPLRCRRMASGRLLPHALHAAPTGFLIVDVLGHYAAHVVPLIPVITLTALLRILAAPKMATDRSAVLSV